MYTYVRILECTCTLGPPCQVAGSILVTLQDVHFPNVSCMVLCILSALHDKMETGNRPDMFLLRSCRHFYKSLVTFDYSVVTFRYRQ